jgi:hypothetical protein
MARIAQPQRRRLTVAQNAGAAVEPRRRIDDHAHRLRTGHAARRQLRIVGGHGAGADQHRIAQGP